MTDLPNSFSEVAAVLTSEGLGDTGAADIKQLSDQGYEIHVGLTAELADDIAKMALQQDIREYCPNDCGERFADRAATEHWLAKRRAAFLLMKKNDDGSSRLAGYGWAGAGIAPEVPGGQTTFAVRIGEQDQGKGLATPFSRLIVLGAANLYGCRDFWLETWASNAGAVHVYHKIGFVTVAEKPSERPTAAGSKVADTRVYMDFPNNLLTNEP